MEIGGDRWEIGVGRPLSLPKQIPIQEGFDMAPSPVVKGLGGAVVAATVLLYVIFW